MATHLKLPGGLQMPTLGLGTFQAMDEKELTTALEAALEAGYRHIDTAWVYRNEAILGKVLNQWIDAGKLKRSDIFLTTKLPPVGVHPDRVEAFIKQSLTSLGLDYVDLYLIHFPVGCQFENGSPFPPRNEDGTVKLEGPTDHPALWKKMEEQVDAGRTKAIGLSNFNISQISQYLKFARIKPANLQIELHVYLQQRELVDFCQKNGITVTAYSPLGTPDYNKFAKSVGMPEKTLPDILNNPVVAKIAKKHSKSTAQVALRFLIQRGIAAIPKSVTPSRLQANFNVYDFKLSDCQMKELKALDIGEKGRIADFLAFRGIQNHPDYPFNLQK